MGLLIRSTCHLGTEERGVCKKESVFKIVKIEKVY